MKPKLTKFRRSIALQCNAFSCNVKKSSSASLISYRSNPAIQRRIKFAVVKLDGQT